MSLPGSSPNASGTSSTGSTPVPTAASFTLSVPSRPAIFPSLAPPAADQSTQPVLGRRPPHSRPSMPVYRRLSGRLVLNSAEAEIPSSASNDDAVPTSSFAWTTSTTSPLRQHRDDPRGYKTSLQRYDGTVFSIAVGASKKEWHIHENVLTKDSAFFALATQKQWNEGQVRRISLPEDLPDIFEVYVGWLYEGKILVQVQPSPAAPGTKPGKPFENISPMPRSVAEEISGLVDCYILGEKLQDPAFQNAVISSLIAALHPAGSQTWYLTYLAQCVPRAYDGTCTGSPLRKLLVDAFVYHSSSALGVIDAFQNAEFCKEAALEMISSRPLPQGSPVSMDTVASAGRYHLPTKPSRPSCGGR